MMQRRSTFAPAEGHPFRRSLGLKRARTRAARQDDQDMKLFVLSFTAFFVCFYTFLL